MIIRDAECVLYVYNSIGKRERNVCVGKFEHNKFFRRYAISTMISDFVDVLRGAAGCWWCGCCSAIIISPTSTSTCMSSSVRLFEDEYLRVAFGGTHIPIHTCTYMCACAVYACVSLAHIGDVLVLSYSPSYVYNDTLRKSSRGCNAVACFYHFWPSALLQQQVCLTKLQLDGRTSGQTVKYIPAYKHMYVCKKKEMNAK